MALGSEEGNNLPLTLLAVGNRGWSNLQGRLQGSGQAEMCIVCVLRREGADI